MKLKFALVILIGLTEGSSCNQDCLDYLLSYFPVSNSAERCGCSMNDFTKE